MKAFIYGTKNQYDDLWRRLTADAARRIKCNVTLGGGLCAKLVFETAGAGKVKAYLLAADGAAQLPAPAEDASALLRELHNGGKIFSSAKEMREAMRSLEGDFNATEGAQITDSNSSRHKIPQRIIDPAELAAGIKEHIVGQDARIDGICECVCNHLSKKSPARPLTVMLPGPTGTGKTATAKRLAAALSEIYGEDTFPLIVVNCNEMREEYRISQLIGSPAGYVGHGETCLMEPVKKSDGVIIIFDEFEKAHPAISTTVMNWMDTGIINLSKAGDDDSMAYECKRSIIIMTSNIDMHTVTGRFDFAEDDPVSKNTAGVGTALPTSAESDACRDAMVRAGYRPEVAARISYFFEYKQLTEADIAKIMCISFAAKAEEYGYKVSGLSDTLRRDLAARYGVSTFGVRSLESDLDRIIGDYVRHSGGLEANAEYTVDGVIGALRFIKN